MDSTPDWLDPFVVALANIPITVPVTTLATLIKDHRRNTLRAHRQCLSCNPTFTPSQAINTERVLSYVLNIAAEIPYSDTRLKVLFCEECLTTYKMLDRAETKEKKHARWAHERRIQEHARWERRLEAYRRGGGTPWSNLDIITTLMTEQESATLRRMPYGGFLQTPYWAVIRRYVIYRQKHCALCASIHDLNVHHKTYAHHGYEHLHLGDLIVLCRTCHAKFHGKLPTSPEE